MKKNYDLVMAAIIAVLVTIVLVMGSSLRDSIKRNVYYERYKQATETLLDEIAAEDNSFLDTIGEGDNYVNYLEAREPLEF